MTLLVYVLVAAAAAFSSASGTSLILNEATVPLEIGAPLQLDCGVEGQYHLCFWEAKDGRVFLVDDVHAGLHVGLRAPHNLTHNQCGIVVDKGSAKDSGEWTCRVFHDGDGVPLKSVKTVGQACTPPFVSVDTGCFYFSELTLETWEEARTFCQSLSPGADLAVLDSCEQHQLLWSHILLNYGASQHWIGAIDRQVQGNFLWVNGSPVSMGLPFWYPGRPVDQSCVYLHGSYGYLYDYNCNVRYHFICRQM